MREIFADTYYWVALTDPREPRHSAALALSSSLGAARLLTTEAVLIEFLNFFAEQGPYWRRRALTMIDTILQNPSIEVVRLEQVAIFQDGLALYAARPDKGYSMTDCVSMAIMRDREIYEVLTSDHHFAQEGFLLLFR